MPAEKKQEEFLRLFEPVRESLSRFARALARNRQDAYDLVGEAVLLAYENFDKLKKKESFKSYIFTITIRCHKRKAWRRRIFGETDESRADSLRSYAPAPDTGHDVEMLYKALALLPDKQREAVILFEISGFSLEEIKELQGGTLSGVKSRLKRGRESLTLLLNPDAEKKPLADNVAPAYRKNGYVLPAKKPVDINNSFKNGAILKEKK